MKDLIMYVVKQDELYMSQTTATFSNFSSAKFYKARYNAEQVTLRYGGRVVPVLIKEIE